MNRLNFLQLQEGGTYKAFVNGEEKRARYAIKNGFLVNDKGERADGQEFGVERGCSWVPLDTEFELVSQETGPEFEARVQALNARVAKGEPVQALFMQEGVVYEADSGWGMDYFTRIGNNVAKFVGGLNNDPVILTNDRLYLTKVYTPLKSMKYEPKIAAPAV